MHEEKPDVNKKLEAMTEMEKAVLRVTEKESLGKTGDYPDGKKIDPTDEGAVKIAIGTKDGHVVISFGTPVSWLAFGPRAARQLAESIRQASYRIEKK